MKFDLYVEQYLETLLEGRPKTDHTKEISLDFSDIEKYIAKMSDDDLNKPIYSKIVQYLKSDASGELYPEDELRQINHFTLPEIKNSIESSLRDHFDNRNSAKFHTDEFVKLFINQRKAYVPYDKNASSQENFSEDVAQEVLNFINTNDEKTETYENVVQHLSRNFPSKNESDFRKAVKQLIQDSEIEEENGTLRIGGSNLSEEEPSDLENEEEVEIDDSMPVDDDSEDFESSDDNEYDLEKYLR